MSGESSYTPTCGPKTRPPKGGNLNDTELTQRGVFTEGRWRKRPIAEILALNNHIKRHPNVESFLGTPRDLLSKGILAT